MYRSTPFTRAYARHFAHMKTLEWRESRQAFWGWIRRHEGAVMAKWLREDFQTWWAAHRKART